MREMQAQMIAEIRRLRQALGEPVDAEVVSSTTPERAPKPLAIASRRSRVPNPRDARRPVGRAEGPNKDH